MAVKTVFRLVGRRSLALIAALSVLPSTFGVPATHAASGTVNVFYAGSLSSLNENLVGPAFAAGAGYTYQGKAAGSIAIANQIKGKIATPDVVEFADPAVNDTLMGSANGAYVSWYLTYARSTLVIGFDPKSRFANEFRLAQRHKLPYYRALEQHGLRLGRTDPNLDPKGYRALFFAGLTQRVFHVKNFKQKVLGSDENPSQVFPEEVLVARMLTGQVNAGVFYLSEVKELGIPYVSLPAKVNLGDANYSKLYATQSFMPSKGPKVRGAPIQYTITIPTTVKNQEGAQAFVRFVLSQRVRAISAAHGLLAYKITAGGDASAVPSALSGFIGK
ncbi:MAG: extracellular solute-binding protein [Chloroflexota bacterium]